uniref:Origin recognition complex subunit 4 n=1 Tax=Ditylenchus dipsaci TaxID=166011 RepID=A0A915D3D6_9BILA
MLQQSMESMLIGLDAQKKKLEALLSNFKKTNQGNSCVLSGRRGSGKTTLLNNLLELYFPQAKKSGELVVLDGDEHTTAKTLTDYGLLNSLSEDKILASQRRIFVIDHFEAFSTKQYQCFLYSILNGSQMNPWLVLLVGTTEDSVNLLEKRIKSRLSKIRINFNVRADPEQIHSCFFYLLQLFADKNRIRQVREDYPGLKPTLEKFASHHSSFSLVKKLAIVFSTMLQMEFSEHLSPLQLLQFSIETCWPTNEMLSILEGVPLRQLCLLRCLSLVQKKMRKMECSCRDVVNEFSKFVNQFDTSMCVTSSVLYKDMDELVSLSAIKLKSGTDIGQLEFRRIFLNIEDETIMACFKNRSLPQKIQHWLES